MDSIDRKVKCYWGSFWEARNTAGSQNDRIFQELSSDAIASYLQPGQTILDLGCGDGNSSAKYAATAAKVVGVDYDAVAIQRAIASHLKLIRKGKLIFRKGNLLTHQARFVGRFDAVITERSLCNLSTPAQQKAAIKLIGEYLKPQGRAIICEPWLQGYNRLDDLRFAFGLAPIKRHWHNLLLDERVIKDAREFRVDQVVTFGVYTLLSRIYYPLHIQPAQPKFASRINLEAASICKILMGKDEFRRLPSQHILYVLRKK